MEHLELFTDGGAIKIGKEFYGSSAFVIRYKKKHFTSVDSVERGTNNYYELKAIRDGLKAIVDNWKTNKIELWIISDSQYSISCISEWFDGWILRKGKYYNKQGKEISNIELILEIRDLLGRIPKYRFIKIKSHIGIGVEDSYKSFKEKNKIKISLEDYLMLVRFNEECDGKITSAFNLKRRAIADELGKDLV